MIPLISDLFISTNLSFSLEGSEGSLGHHQLVLFRSPTEVSDGRLCSKVLIKLNPASPQVSANSVPDSRWEELHHCVPPPYWVDGPADAKAGSGNEYVTLAGIVSPRCTGQLNYFWSNELSNYYYFEWKATKYIISILTPVVNWLLPPLLFSLLSEIAHLEMWE